MKSTKLKKFALPAALVAGGLTAGSMFSPIGFASAQESDTDAETPTTTEQPTTEAETKSETKSETKAESSEGHKRHKRGKAGQRLAKSEAAAEALGLTQEEIKAGFDEDKSLSQMAEENGVALEDLKAALAAEMNERIDAAVADGRIDADKAEEKKASVDEAVNKVVDATPGDRKGRGHRGQKLEGVAEVLGLSTDEVREGLTAGKTLADLATEQGVSEDELVASLVAGIQEKVDAAVESGKIDADKAAERSENAEERVRGLVNGERPEKAERPDRGERPERGERRGNRGNKGQKSQTEDSSIANTGTA